MTCVDDTTTGVPGNATVGNPDQECDRSREDPDEQADARTVQESHEDVATEHVRAKRMRP